MPITKTLRIGCNSYLPILNVSEGGIGIIDGDKGPTNIRWANFDEWIEMLHAAKQSAVALGIFPMPPEPKSE